MKTLCFEIISLFYIILSLVLLIVKKHVVSDEYKIYKKMIFSNIFGLICEILLFLSVFIYGTSSLLVTFLVRFYLIYLILFISLIGNYVVYISNISFKKPLSKIIYILFILSSVFMLLLNVKFKSEYSTFCTGSAVTFTYIYSFIWIVVSLILMAINLKSNSLKKYIPLIVMFVGSGCVAFIQKIYPEFTFITVIESISLFIMYHTIENPDVKLIEYEKKEIEKIRQAAESKSEFLSSTSHELRTPLNAIIGLSEDIESFKDVSPEILDDVKDLVNASNVLLDIISNILDSSKIESGKLDIVECDYDVKEEFETIGNIYKVKAFKKNLELNISIDENVPQILYGDRQRIKQVISNLLDNAVKFTDVGKINYLIKWDNSKSNLIITVSDSGNGLRKEEIETFLNESKDLRIEKIYSAQGTGLGLTISRNLIKLLNGYATVDTKTYAGTKFTIYIPQKIGDIEILKAMNKKVDIDINSLNYAGKRLLVVDDNPINIKVLRKAIKSFNFEIEECYNGKDAIDKIELNNNYDLVFMDIMMPVMGGEEAIKKLREMSNFNTPVVALTADAVSGATQKYKKMGFNDYMSKPFSRDMVANKLYSVLGGGDR